MSNNLIESYRGEMITLEEPTLLYESGEHQIYWLGIEEETAFRCNVYLIRSGEEYLLVDPGSRQYFDQVKSRVGQIIDPTKIGGIILCHQDPDVSASMIDWLELNPDLLVISSPRTNVLLPHYGRSDYRFYDISDTFEYRFANGHKLRFIEAPFLHFPGAFTTYDETSQLLFFGDIWAALDTDWQLVSDDFEIHKLNMDLFHVDYMASNIAARGFVRRLDGIRIEGILPQHGSIFAEKDVPLALHYLKNLRCGLDIVYADLG
ncbi:MAG: MBL fold metallo-hydrolase [Sulfuricurvum sp.]|nr:MBL fold metallo-hydrolase [Sulfuricurvum sp.]